MKFRFSIVAEVAPSVSLDETAAGELGFIPITGGTVAGDLEGSVIGSGGDWCLIKSAGTYRVEARYGIRTTEGAYVDVVNTGILTRPGEGAHTPGRGGEYFMTTPVFRTTHPALAWLTHSVFVGHAVAGDGATSIDVFEVIVPGHPA
ncbi:hypothetical protein D477_002371 [Arthrobacter crystallopoietes BAB-32]|uniref:Uncharacterized protein n=1 Tax=Arthrobacter crystallopoietes BAB-32 TaxID=1246476 RepID=N1VC05_9MICC|nr:hypothetical protein D477_002371 [Arthrobacter crystallopoietes BAB-32]